MEGEILSSEQRDGFRDDVSREGLFEKAVADGGKGADYGSTEVFLGHAESLVFKL